MQPHFEQFIRERQILHSVKLVNCLLPGFNGIGKSALGYNGPKRSNTLFKFSLLHVAP